MNYNDVSDVRTQLDLTNLKSIIDGLKDSKNIDEKEIILGLYYTFYNLMISSLEVINVNISKEYSDCINKTMNTVIRLSKGRKDIVSAKSFIGNFLYYLSSNELSKVNPIVDIIDLFRNDLDTFINVEKNIVNNFRLVDKKFNLEEKVLINIHYKNYISDLYIIFTSIYGVNDTVDILDDLKNCLDLAFPEILNTSKNLEELNGLFRCYTKDKLKEIYLANGFNFYGDNSGFAYDLIQYLDEDERKIFELYYLYKLALFEANDFLNMQINDESMSFELGIDRDVFKKRFNSIAKKSKIMHLKQIFRLGKTKKRTK